MALASLFQLRTYTVLRARLAACLMLAFLAIGMLDVVAYRGATPRPFVTRAAESSSLAGLLPANAPHQFRVLRRQRTVSARPPRLEEIHAVSPSVDWPDLEKGAPTLPRVVIRKLPADESADGDDAERQAPATGYSSRAPPPLA